MATLQERVQAVLAKHDWTDVDLANAIGASRSSIANWRIGKNSTILDREQRKRFEALERGEQFEALSSDRAYFDAKFAELSQQLAKLEGILLGTRLQVNEGTTFGAQREASGTKRKQA